MKRRNFIHRIGLGSMAAIIPSTAIAFEPSLLVNSASDKLSFGIVTDFHHHQNGIDYIEINSMSYQWLEDTYRNSDRFPEDLYKEYKWLPNLVPYKDPLYAFAKIDPQGLIRIEGVRSKWMAPSPYDMGIPKLVYGSEYSAEISDYKLKF